MSGVESVTVGEGGKNRVESVGARKRTENWEGRLAIKGKRLK